VFRSLAVSFGFNAFASVLGSVAVFVVIASLSPGDWGRAAAILGAGQFAGAVMSFGSQTERIKRYSRMEPDLLRETSRRNTTSRLVVVALVLLVALCASHISPEVSSALVATAGVFASLGATNHLIALRRFAAAGVLQVLEKTVALGIVATLIAFGMMEPLLLAPAMGAGGILVALVSFASIRPDIGAVRIGARPREIVRIWKGSFYLGIASVAPSALLLDVTIVLAFAGPTSAGVFALATKLTAPLSIAASAVVAVMLPLLSASSNRTIRRPKSREWAGLAAILLGLAVVFVSAPLWVPLFFGTEYSGAVWPARLYVLNVAVVLVTRALVTTLQAWDDDRFASILVAGQVAAALVGLALGAHLGGAFGASLSVLTTNVVLAMLLISRVRRFGRQQAD
jgi:O-antigen/teichoic acid export membrane protein